jgi:serine/threonine protein kinase
MGKVYKARLKWTDSWVALKKIKTGRLASRSEVRRFLDEVRAAASLHHPNIVPIYHVGADDGQPFFTMKLFEHGSLQQHLPRFEKDHRAAVQMLAQVARAVHFAHRHGILHRDLKPANILLDAQEQPYVADFGLAKRLRPAATETAGRSAAPAAEKSAPVTAREQNTDPGPEAELDVRYLAPEQAGQTQALDEAGEMPDRTVTDAKAKGATHVGAFLGTKGYRTCQRRGRARPPTFTAWGRSSTRC